MNHTILLNHLIAKHNLKSYLEIGVRATAQNFNHIQCEFRHGVDPNVIGRGISTETSDEFFNALSDGGFVWWQPAAREYKKFDLIFIDGLHHADQVQRDFENSLRCLNDNGFIVLHDCLPTEEITTCVPRGSQKVWFGDVYRFILNLHTYDGIDFCTYNFDCGCTVVWKDPTKKGSGKRVATDWDSYLKNKHLLRIKEAVE